MSKKNPSEERDLGSLSKFSPEQQCAIVKLLIEDIEFQSKVKDLININTLSSYANLRRIASMVLEFLNKGAVVDYKLLDTKIHSEIANAIDLEETLVLLHEKIENTTLTPNAIQFLKDSVYPIIEHQEAIRFHKEVETLLKENKVIPDLGKQIRKLYKDFDNRTLFNTSIPIKMKGTMEEVEDILNSEIYVHIPTSSKALNNAMGGGLRKSDVGMFMAGSGVGKTCVTTGFVGYAACCGCNAVHFVLEDKPRDIKQKYLAFFSGIEVSDFQYKKYAVEQCIRENYQTYTNMLDHIRTVYAMGDDGHIRRFTTADIDETLNRLTNDGYKPDLVVLDYYDRLRPMTKGEIWDKDKDIMNDLVDIAAKYNIAFWIACQGSKAAQSRNVRLGNDLMSGGQWKILAAPNIVYLQRLKDDNGLATLTMGKNRYHPECDMKVDFNNGNCRFEREDEMIAFDTQRKDAEAETLNSINNAAYPSAPNSYAVNTAQQVYNNNR